MTDDKHCKECGKELTGFEVSIAAEVCADCKFKATKELHGSAQAELDRIREKGRERRWRFMEKSKAAGKRQFSAIISKEAYDTMCGIRDAAQLAGKPTSFGEIIEKALACYNETINKSSIDTTSVSSHETTNRVKGKSEPDQSLKRSPVNDLPEPAPELPTVGDLPKSAQNYTCVEETEDPAPEPTGKKIAEKPLDLFPEQVEPKQKIPKRGTPEYSDWLFDKIDPMKRSGMSSIKIERQFNADGVKPPSTEKNKFNRNSVDSFYKGKLKKKGLRWDKSLKKPVPIENNGSHENENA